MMQPRRRYQWCKGIVGGGFEGERWAFGTLSRSELRVRFWGRRDDEFASELLIQTAVHV